jgi:hypothetical protein
MASANPLLRLPHFEKQNGGGKYHGLDLDRRVAFLLMGVFWPGSEFQVSFRLQYPQHYCYL